MGESWLVNSDFKLEQFIAHAKKLYQENKYVTFEWRTGRQRSLQQNNAMHKYFELLAEELNSKGFDMRVVLKSEIEIPWTKQSVKDHLWVPIQKAMTGETSTTKPERQDYVEIYETLNRYLVHSEKLKGFESVPWPCRNE